MMSYVTNQLIHTLNIKFHPPNLLVPQYCYPRINTALELKEAKTTSCLHGVPIQYVYWTSDSLL